MFRQGDVLLVPIAEGAVPPLVHALPQQARDGRGRLVLARGEATGHTHAVVGPGSLARESDEFGQAWLHLAEGGRVVHEEHAAIALARGWYRIVRQREYTPGSLRVVAD
ncbi:hypothetical protein GXW83_26360 [Streptacidiphilus sp. PB12-B1b]|uniref:hypothetical protein n=1 Tax=Streptacidiphilus sp. PB12-B1b TaxID=2705012 RepID=UPI0015FC6092|nr:hypothetical protein [Streptacidiphilus sp. PB12-B1b]QMU78706.1 hypothetical protein GXW83_26360 [Streptacidiphilus sp. PB12-B1b]